MAATEIANQFGALPMDSLIGGPLQAACKAQVQLANATADFIKYVGLTPSDPQNENSPLVARTVEFKYKKLKEDGTGYDDMVIEAPLLAIVKVPNLSITSMDITFDMEVKTADEHKDSTDASASMEANMRFGGFFVRGNVNIKGSISSHQENTRRTDTSAKYHVELQARDGGISEGLSRILDMMHTAIQPKNSNGIEGGSPDAVESKSSEEAA